MIRENNRQSHRFPMRHTDDCEDMDCPVCIMGVFVCADCGAEGPQLEAVHCVDRVKHDWQAAVAVAVHGIVANWDQDVTPAQARQCLTSIFTELEDRWIRAGSTVAQFGIPTPLNVPGGWAPDDLSAAIQEIGRRMREAEQEVVTLTNEYDKVQRQLRDWREGDREGVAAHMHAFREQAQEAEGRIARLKELVSTLTTERDVAERKLALAEKDLGNADSMMRRAESRAAVAEERLRRVKEIVNDMHPPLPQKGSHARPPVQPGFACPSCGHRHPPDGMCV